MRTLGITEPAPGVVVLTLQRPEALNALSREMFAELTAAGRELADRADVRAVVLSGSGDGFCAGYDLEAALELPNQSLAQLYELQDLATGAFATLYSLPKPVIAAVHGPAVGGGFSLALTADIRLVGESARLQAVFVRLGLSGGDLGASWLLPRIVGSGLAAEILYTGRAVPADEAVRIGLANRVVPDERLVDEAVALATGIAANPGSGVTHTKRSLRANQEVPSYTAALEMESRAQVGLLREPATAEAMEKIRTRWSEAARPERGR